MTDSSRTLLSHRRLFFPGQPRNKKYPRCILQAGKPSALYLAIRRSWSATLAGTTKRVFRHSGRLIDFPVPQQVVRPSVRPVFFECPNAPRACTACTQRSGSERDSVSVRSHVRWEYHCNRRTEAEAEEVAFARTSGLLIECSYTPPRPRAVGGSIVPLLKYPAQPGGLAGWQLRSGTSCSGVQCMCDTLFTANVS